MRSVTENMAGIFNGILGNEDDEQPDPPKEKPVEQKTVHILPSARTKNKNGQKQKKKKKK